MAEHKDIDYSFTRKLTNLVFCKDCTHCLEKDMFGHRKVFECQVTGYIVTGGDYCSFGERKACDG